VGLNGGVVHSGGGGRGRDALGGEGWGGVPKTGGESGEVGGGV